MKAVIGDQSWVMSGEQEKSELKEPITHHASLITWVVT